jgi:hypothetical protein
MIKKDLSKDIIKRIKKGKVKMRPKAYFVAGSTLLGIGFAGFLLFAIVFMNRAFFRFRVFGPFGNLFLGRAGIRPFILTFPFLSLILALTGIVGGLFILRRYEFSYKRSLVTLLVGTTAFVITAGAVLDVVGFGEKVASAGTISSLYSYHAKTDSFVIGEIKTVSDEKITLITPEGEEVVVVYNKDTRLPSGSDFKQGDRIRAVGGWKKDVFFANGINKGGLRWRVKKSSGPLLNQKSPFRDGMRLNNFK